MKLLSLFVLFCVLVALSAAEKPKINVKVLVGLPFFFSFSLLVSPFFFFFFFFFFFSQTKGEEGCAKAKDGDVISILHEGYAVCGERKKNNNNNIMFLTQIPFSLFFRLLVMNINKLTATATRTAP